MKYFLILAMLLVGCEHDQDRATAIRSDGSSIASVSKAEEVCYRGVVYVQFYPRSTAAWGGVKLMQSGRPEPCKEL